MNVLAYAGNKVTIKNFVIILLIITTSHLKLSAQESILDTRLSLRHSDVSISDILRSVSRKTDYYFTYDFDLVEPERLTTIKADNQPLRSILDTIFSDRALKYSLIDNHIIIYQSVNESTPLIREEGREPVYKVSGVVTDAGNGKPLPYASIGVKYRGKGTTSNYEGEYNLNLGKEFIDDTLVISYIGFYSRHIPVSQAINNDLNISLSRMYVPIPEVIIRNREPQELLRNAREMIPDNYGRTPARMTAFYRESVSKRNKLLMYSEAVLELYKSSYTPSLFNDQVKIYKSRKINNLDPDDTLTFKLKSGLDGSLSLDIIRNNIDFLKEESFQDYVYRMTDIINIDEEAAYVIEFRQNENIDYTALPVGSIYINTNNYGVHGLDFEINQDYIDKLDRSFIQQSAKGYVVKVRSAKYRVNYRYVNKRFYLNHVRGDLEFYARKRNRVFGSTYTIFFEMAVTGIDTLNVQRFAREERAPRHSIFSEIINSYDREFWGTDNFVRPEESITEALSRINARLSQYKTNNSQ